MACKATDKRVEYKTKMTALMSELTFGIEIEQVGIGRYSDSNCLRAINEMFVGRERWKQVSDSSIRGGNGSEFVSGIMKWSSLSNVQEAIRLIKSHGGRTHDSCGVHVHIDGSRFLRDPKALVRLCKLVHKYEDHIYHSVKSDNRNSQHNGWSKSMCPRFLERLEALKNPTIDDIRLAWYQNDWGHRERYNNTRYRLLNLHALFSKGTIEFRCFNSTLHAGKAKSYIQLCGLIVCEALLKTRASSKKRPFNQEKGKYEVRTFLLRLGAIGEEFSTLRFHAQKGLKGSSAKHVG